MKTKRPHLILALLISLFALTSAFAESIDIPFKRLKGPNNTINDAVMGVSFTYPAGWNLERAFRWGRDNSETTLAFLPRKAPTVAASVYYQPFSPDSPRPEDIRVWFRGAYTGKEASRKRQSRLYQNLPESLLFDTTSTGLPRCSYVATFESQGKTMAEYYIRVAGTDAYVMIILTVPIDQFEAIRGELDQLADTVRVR